MCGCGIDMFILSLLVDVSENIVENKVSGGLLGKDEGLAELLELRRLVGRFADDLNDNVVEGRLGIDVGDTDFAVLEVEFEDTFLNCLQLLNNVLCQGGVNSLQFDPQRQEQLQPLDQRRIEIACRRITCFCQQQHLTSMTCRLT